MLGIFGKLPGTEPVKTRLQTRLARADAERLYLASLADTIETASRAALHPVLFLPAPLPRREAVADVLRRAGLAPEIERRLQLAPQRGSDLGARLGTALATLVGMAAIAAPGTGESRFDEHGGAFIVGSDSPSLDVAAVQSGLVAAAIADLVLGPASDGGFWGIGVRRAVPDLLEGMTWSTPQVLEATAARAQALGLEVVHLATATDLDRPEDLELVASEIASHRRSGDFATGRHTERVMAALGLGAVRWT